MHARADSRPLAGSRVLITNGQARNTLAAVRQLARDGAHVIAADDQRFAIAFFSKYCAERRRYPSPDKGAAEWLGWLRREIAVSRPNVVVPVSDDTVEPLVQHQEEIRQYCALPVPTREAFALGWNKAKTMHLAQSIGVPCPATCAEQDIETIVSFAHDLGYPVVLKPQVGSGSRGLSVVSSESELRTRVAKTQSLFGPILTQEYIPGETKFQVCTLFNHRTELRALCVHRFLREYPVGGGVATMLVTDHWPEVEQLGVRLMEATGWFGVAAVEFKVDSRNGTPKLMEINPRFWGTLGGSIAAGVDFPGLLVQTALHDDVPACLDFKVGVHWRWLVPGDLLHFLSNPGRFSMRPSFFNFWLPDSHDAILSRDDPLPTAALILMVASNIGDARLWRHVLRRF